MDEENRMLAEAEAAAKERKVEAQRRAAEARAAAERRVAEVKAAAEAKAEADAKAAEEAAKVAAAAEHTAAKEAAKMLLITVAEGAVTAGPAQAASREAAEALARQLWAPRGALDTLFSDSYG